MEILNLHTGRDFVQFGKTESVLNKGAKKIALLFNPPPVLSLEIMPYFLARTMDRHVREKYLWRIDNNLLKEYIIEKDKELNFLETQGAFDDLIILNGLYEIIDKYYKRFMDEYGR